MHEDADALGVLRPDHEPRATEFVPEMLDLIGLLETRGLAYRATDGDVNYAVRKFAGYGQLSGKSLDDLRAGERVEVDSAKQDPLDFVLWKHAKPGEPAWPSPWGEGRPGWHIECSAMSSKLLGNHFDIHGGGQDLQFPHHENEIAQSEGAHQCSFVNYWMHNGFVRVDNEKMSKSLGNFFTIREVLERYDAEVVRFFILRAHYRSALNYSDSHLDDAKRSLDSLYFALRDVPPAAAVDIDWSNDFAARFAAALDEDFDSHGAIAVLFELAGEVNRQRSSRAFRSAEGACRGDRPARTRAAGVPAQRWQPSAGGLDEAAIEALIADRAAAKKAKNFAEADRIRDQLKAPGSCSTTARGERPGGAPEVKTACENRPFFPNDRSRYLRILPPGPTTVISTKREGLPVAGAERDAEPARGPCRSGSRGLPCISRGSDPCRPCATHRP
jgi:cysteinyl-tRNA synthetase